MFEIVLSFCPTAPSISINEDGEAHKKDNKMKKDQVRFPDGLMAPQL